MQQAFFFRLILISNLNKQPAMRSFALLYLTIIIGIFTLAGLAALRLVPASHQKPRFGPEVGDGTAATSSISSRSHSAGKQDLEKRYTVTLPAGYYYAFKNLSAATEHPSYKTFKFLSHAGSWSPDLDLAKECTGFCDRQTRCTFANLYKEKFGPNPEDEAIKCSIYDLPSGSTHATNTRQWRNGYHITISQSYGFSQSFNPDLPGWSEVKLNAAIIGKRTNPTDPDPYMGYVSIPVTDPELCAAECEEKTTYNSRHPSPDGTYRACNFFNYYVLIKNGVPYETICSFYLKQFNNSFATNHGYWSGDDAYTIGDSWGFTKILL